MYELNVNNNWLKLFDEEFKKEYFKDLNYYLKKEINNHKTIYPPLNKIFNAFNLTNFEDVKVVIVGQDPYHGVNQANGLSFSVGKKTKLPPSLLNIFKELESDLGYRRPEHGNLEKWAKQGVLLLNSVLTVEKGKPNSHVNKGWEIFTDKILVKLSNLKKNSVFVLWGVKAQNKAKIIDSYNNLVIKSSHPSPYSASKSFFGSRPFSRINAYLKKNKINPIDWNLSD